MRLLQINWHPQQRQLQQFGLIALVALPLAGWLLGGRQPPYAWGETYRAVMAGLVAAGIVCAVFALVWPRALKPLFLILTLAALPIGLVVGEAALALIYFGVFTPVALWFRLIGRDALQRRFEPEATTYWQAKAQPADAKSYFHQS